MIVFPARAGMSRDRRFLGVGERGFPRPRGDEPTIDLPAGVID